MGIRLSLMFVAAAVGHRHAAVSSGVDGVADSATLGVSGLSGRPRPDAGADRSRAIESETRRHGSRPGVNGPLDNRDRRTGKPR